MSVLLISIDSLRRDFLGAYADRPTVLDYDVETDNLDRFAERAAVFETNYAGSLPCMPARREWHAGVQEFLWRPWGPVEPFDRTLGQAAREVGVPSQLITDHYHYFQHGSHGYYEDYNGFEFVRGHEYDAWRTDPPHPDERLLDQTRDESTDPADGVEFTNRSQYARNVDGFDDETDFFSPKVFSTTADWLRANREWDEWLCYVDSFDVHEPFHVPEPYASMYTDEDPRDPDLPNWPYYGRIDAGQSALTERELDFVRSQFAGKVTMVDRWFGQVLDALDEAGAWDDTTVIVTSDHGFMLGEEGWIAKNDMPVYDVLANTPLLIHHPDGAPNGERVDALTSAIDLHATALEAIGASVPESSHSRSLLPVLEGGADPADHRDWALFGYWGSSVNVTDGEYVYMRPCDPTMPTECYSTTMMNPNSWFTPVEPKPDAGSGTFLPYTDTPVWRFEGKSFAQHDDVRLYGPDDALVQRENLAGEADAEEARMRDLLVDAMDDLDAPDRQFERLGLDAPS